MARTRKSIQPLNLYKYDVLIEDKATRSDYFKVTQFDGNFYGGRNAFLLAGTGVLRPNSKILVEILNKDGTTVYSAPITSFIEGNSRLVQAEVYNDTPIGPGKIVLLGCADTYLDGTPVPSNWQGKYNVRWIADVIISPLIENKTPIRFEATPSIVATEKFYYTPSSSQFVEQIKVPVDIEFTQKYYNVFPNGYLAKISGPGSTTYNSDYLGGVITGAIALSNGTVSTTSSINIPITKIYNSTLGESQGTLIYINNTLLSNAFLSSSGIYTTEIEPLGPVTVSSSINIQYNKLTTINTGSAVSFANLRLVDLKTISGEIHRIRLSYKSATEPGEFVSLGDIDTTVAELLAVDSSSRIAQTGQFTDIKIDDYWYSETMSLQKNEVTPILPAYYISSSLSSSYLPIVQSSVTALDSITATPQIVNGRYINDASYFIGTKNTNTIQVFPRVEYTLAFDATVSNTSASVALNQTDYSLEVYLVAEAGYSTKLLDTNPRGQLLGILTPTSTFQRQNFEGTEFNFIPKIIATGNFGLRFIAYGGFWNIANVSVKAAQEPFFSPDEINILIPNANYTDSILTFRAQYLDVNNNSIGINTFSTPTYFTGSGTTLNSGTFISASFATTASFAPTILPTGIVSSSAQVIAFLPTGTVSSSQQINTGSFTGSFIGTHSGSTFGTSSWAQSSSVATSASFAPTILPAGVVSSSGQVSYIGLSNIPSNIVSSSAQVIAFLPVGTVSSSRQINTGSFTGSFIGTHSGSTFGTSSWAISSSFATTASFALSSSLATTASYVPLIPSTKPTFVIDGGEWIVRDLTSPANYSITINSGSGVINNTRISWPQTAITTAASNSIVFATQAGTISSSVTFGSYISESLNKLVLHRSYVDTATYGTRIYAVAESRTFNRSTPVGEFNQYRLLDYVVTSSAWSGSVALTPSRANVNFYFANIGLLPFVKDEPAIVRGHLDRQIEKFYNNARNDASASIYASWQQLHGTTYGAFYKWPYDIISPEGVVSASRADSHDSYAATFLLLAHKYATEAPDGLAWWDSNFTSIYDAMFYNILIPVSFIGAGYLTKTFQDINVYPYYQTLDNMEVYAALKNVFPLMRSRGGGQAASASAQGAAETNILNGIRDAWSGSNSTGYARYTYSGSAWLTSSLQTFYPEVSIQSGYSLYNIPEAIGALATDRGARLSRVNDLLLNTAPNWYTTRQYDVFPNGYVAASLVASGHTDIANDYLKFLSTHITYDSPGRYYINEIGWVKYIQNKLDTNDLTGGTANYIPLWTSATLQSSSIIYQSAGNIGIGTTSPGSTLHIQGNVSASSYTSSLSNQIGFAGTASFAVSASRAISASWAPSTGGGSGTVTSIVAGSGLSGGTITSTGTISLDTSSVHFLDGVKKELNTEGVISSSVQISHNSTTGYVANEHINHTSVSITAGSGLSGGGTIAATRTLTLDTSSVHFLDGVKKELNTEGVISSSTQQVVSTYTNATDNRVLTSTGVGGINGESNLTFNGTRLDVSGQISITGSTGITHGIAMNRSGWNSLFRVGAVSASGDDFWITSNWNPSTAAQDSSEPGYITLAPKNELRTVIGGTRMVTVTNSGVGIGTATPATQLHVSSSGGNTAEIRLQAADGRSYSIGSTGTGYGSTNNLIFYDVTVGAERLRINSSGQVGIGTPTPSATLHVSGTMAVQSIFEKVIVTASAPPATLNYNVLDGAILFHSGSATANWTLNFRGNASTTLNSIMPVSSSMTVTLLTRTTTAYSSSAYQIDGSSITPRWQGGVSGSGNANSIDAHTFTIIKISSTPTYLLLGSITKYT